MSLSVRQVAVISAGLMIAAISLRAQETTEVLQVPETASDLYFKAEAGLAWLQDVRLHSVNQDLKHDLKFDVGARFDLGMGYNFSPSWAVELEAGAIWNSAHKLDGNPFDETVNLYQIPVLVNYIYKVPVKGQVQPFIGVGIGPVVSIFERSFTDVDFHGSDVTFGYQAMAGFTYYITEQMNLTLAYKFLGTTAHDWEDKRNGEKIDTIWYIRSDESFSHSVVLGLTVVF